MNLVITGATGYIGNHLISLALKNGHHTISASRSPPNVTSLCWLPFDLTSSEVFKLPADTHAVVHLAANTTSDSILLIESEFLAAQRLINLTNNIAAKFIYISSQTARRDAPTTYGRLKWRIEQEVLTSGGIIVRPGQVYGGYEGGLFGSLVDMVRQLPILPAFLPSPKVQPIHVDDLAHGLLNIIERDDIQSGIYCLASPEYVTFTELLSTISIVRVRKRRWFAPVPVFLVKVVSLIIRNNSRIHAALKRLSSLFELPLMDTSKDLEQLALKLRPLSSGMHPSGNGNRRRLLREGNAIFKYLSKEQPDASLLRRYVYAIENVRNSKPLELPEVLYSFPFLFSLIDKQANFLTPNYQELIWRLDAAMLLAEATPKGACSFLGVNDKHGVLSGLFGIFKALSGELFWRVSRIVCYPLIRLWLYQMNYK